jgi:hypothetical protein
MVDVLTISTSKDTIQLHGYEGQQAAPFYPSKSSFKANVVLLGLVLKLARVRR